MASDVSGEELNVGSGTEASAREIAERLIEIVGRRRRGRVPAGRPGPHEAARREQREGEATARLGGFGHARRRPARDRRLAPTGRVNVLVIGCDRLRRVAPDPGSRHRRARRRRARATIARAFPAGRRALHFDLAAPDWPTLPAVDAVVHLAQANVPFPDGATRSSPSTPPRRSACSSTLAARARAPIRPRVVGLGLRIDGAGAADARSHRWRRRTSTPRRRSPPSASPRHTTSSSDVAILRLFVPYGPGQVRRMLPRLAERIRSGEPIRARTAMGARA